MRAYFRYHSRLPKIYCAFRTLLLQYYWYIIRNLQTNILTLSDKLFVWSQILESLIHTQVLILKYQATGYNYV